MISCYCDGSTPSFMAQEIRRARKQHRCYECRGTILPGERYESTAGVWEGDFQQYKTCEMCRDIRQWVQNNVPCFCWTFGDVEEDARRVINEVRQVGGEEVVGIEVQLLRMIVRRNQHNAARAGGTPA